MKQLKIYVAILALLLVGCSGASYEKPKEIIIEKNKTINLSFDDTWQKIVDWFAIHNSPIKTMDKNSGLIATDYNLSIDNYIIYADCGKYTSGTFVRGNYSNPIGNFNVLVKKVTDTSTNININCFFNVTINEYSTNMIGGNPTLISSTKIDCQSTGRLEKEIFEYLTGIINNNSPAPSNDK